MPISKQGKKVLRKMEQEYGKKGKQIYYATAKKQGRSEKTFKKQ